MGAERITDTLLAFVRELPIALPLLLHVLIRSLVESFKAFLPCGVLPRKSIRNKVMLITGSGSGIGRLCAIEFARLGARLVLWDIDAKGNEETRALIEKEGKGGDPSIPKAHTYTVDLSDRQQIYATAERVKREVGDVDILFNNAGIVTGRKLFDCPDELIERTMAVNTHALFYTAKAFVPAMMERNSGHVITTASMAGHFGVAGLVDYCASKYAAVGFGESLRAELRRLGKEGIPVTTIAPFYIDTGMFEGIKSRSPLWFPIMQPKFVVDRIVEAVLTDAEQLVLPKTCNLVLFLKGILHPRAMWILDDYYKLNMTMDDYVGRNPH